MKQLHFDCSCTDVWVSPPNWKTISGKKALSTQWYVQCNFYDPLFKEKYPRGFPFRKKLNRLKTIEQRKAAVEHLLKEIPELFQKGYNPITDKFMIEPEPEVGPEQKHLTEICTDTPFLLALDLAHKSIKVAQSTYDDIKYMLDRFKPAAEQLRFEEIRIYDVKRKHIRFVLDQLEKTEETFSAHKFNKYRGYLSTLYKELMEYEAVESDIVLEIKKRIHETKIREILTEEQRKNIAEHLGPKFPDFLRFINVFFHSGGRLSELLNLKTEDVFLEKQRYQVLLKKGKQYKWVERVIKDVAVEFWIKSLYGAKKGDFIFSVGLKPGERRIRREQIDRRWRVHVKKKLGITADIYSLKHSNLDETAEILSIQDAAAMASHTSTKMVEKHYAVGEKGRQMIRLQTVNNNFA